MSNAPRTTLQLVRPDGAGDEAIRAVEAELKLREGPPGAARRSRSAARPNSPPTPTTIRRATNWRWRWTQAATAKAPSTELLEIRAPRPQMER